jgi:uncharacterized membrane protein YeiH
VNIVELFGDDTFTGVLDIAGIIVGSLLGAAAAVEEHFDITGTLVLALACGLGGGIIRDVLLGSGPPLALIEPSYIVTALIGGIVMLAFDVPGWRYGNGALLTGDALLLGFFAAAGCRRAALAGMAPVSVLLLGVVSAVGGGMLRDILMSRPPAALTGGTLYASVAIAAAATYAVMDALDAATGATTLACIGVGAMLRGAALYWRIETPTRAQPLKPARLVSHLGRTRRKGRS